MPRVWVAAEVDERRRAVERGPALVVFARADADGDLLYLIRRYRPAFTDAL